MPNVFQINSRQNSPGSVFYRLNIDWCCVIIGYNTVTVKDYISNYDGDDYQIYGKIDLALEKIGRELDVETRKIGMIDKRLWNVVHIGINEMYEEGLQIRRSSKSVSSNIVEGFGRRRYQADYIKFLVVWKFKNCSSAGLQPCKKRG